MAKSTVEILRPLIEARLQELDAERDQLRQLLRGGGTATATARPAGRRKRSKLTSAQKKAISLRMKKYWAERKRAK